MLANVFTKSLRDRWVGTTVGMSIAGAILVLAMAAYQDIDIGLYTDLPEGMRSVMGIPEDAEAATLAYSVVLGMVAALTLAGLAVTMGASSVAGEERDGTIGLLLANPRSRRRVLVAKGGAMMVLAVAGAALMVGASYLAPALLDVEIGATDLLAMNVHLWANALLWGALAMAVGAVTGNRSLAVSVSAGGMVGCYFLVGLLPLAESVAGGAKVLPWYWFDGHDPLNTGVAIGYLGLQVAAVAALFGIAWWGVEARDLSRPMGSRNLMADVIDRVRSNERAAVVVDRLGGGAKVNNIWIKTAAEGQALVLVVAFVMFVVMGLLMGPLFSALEGSLAEAAESFPENLLAIFGGGDLSTPEGWYRLEIFSLMAPIAVTLVAVAVGARALAGEEHDRTMGLLLANPVPRRRVVLEKLAAMVLHVVVVGLAIFAGVTGGSLIAGLGMSTGNIAAASLQATLLGVLFGTVALALSAATGSVRAAITGTIGVFGVTYAVNVVLSVSDDLGRWITLSPFDWYLGGEPLVNGVEWRSVALLILFSVACTGAAVVLFDRRDLRRG